MEVAWPVFPGATMVLPCLVHSGTPEFFALKMAQVAGLGPAGRLAPRGLTARAATNYGLHLNLGGGDAVSRSFPLAITLEQGSVMATPLSGVRVLLNGGDDWIRTSGSLRAGSFRNCCHKPDSATSPNCLVVRPGFGPRQQDSKSRVLPLHQRTYKYWLAGPDSNRQCHKGAGL